MSNLQEQHFNHVEQTFANAFDTMLAKNHDYAEDRNPYSNFEFGAESAGITVEQGLLFLIGIKMARLKQLLVSDKTPNNESVEDTLEDTINYTAILKAFRTLKGSPAELPGDKVINDFDHELDAIDEENEPDYLSEPQVATGLGWFHKFLNPTTKTSGLFEKV